MYPFESKGTTPVDNSVEDLNPPRAECSFCLKLGLFGPENADPPVLHLLTEEETRIHKAMREIKSQVRKLKKRLQQAREECAAGPQERTENGKGHYEVRDKLHRQALAEDILDGGVRLDQFRKIWSDLDTARVAAAHERMRLLGHVS